MVRERCVCGAEFESNLKEAVRLLKEWRRVHKCVIVPASDRVEALASVDIVPESRTPELHIGFRPDVE
jgi:hypothetical protein